MAPYAKAICVLVRLGGGAAQTWRLLSVLKSRLKPDAWQAIRGAAGEPGFGMAGWLTPRARPRVLRVVGTLGHKPCVLHERKVRRLSWFLRRKHTYVCGLARIGLTLSDPDLA